MTASESESVPLGALGAFAAAAAFVAAGSAAEVDIFCTTHQLERTLGDHQHTPAPALHPLCRFRSDGNTQTFKHQPNPPPLNTFTRPLSYTDFKNKFNVLLKIVLERGKQEENVGHP